MGEAAHKIADITDRVNRAAANDLERMEVLPERGALRVPESKSEAPHVPDELVKNAPGLVGDLARWIKRGQQNTPNGMALLAALSIVSTLCGRQFKGPTASALNLLTVTLAPSGAGKDWVMDAVSKFLSACAENDNPHLRVTDPEKPDASVLDDADTINALQLIAASPRGFSSEAAIRGALWRSPILFVRIDEFGDALRSWVKGQSSESEIPRFLRDIYTAKPINGKAYAANTGASKDLEEKRLQTLKEPFLTLLGASTPKQFYDALGGDAVENGTLNRFLIFDEKAKPSTVVEYHERYFGDGMNARQSVPFALIDRAVTLFNAGKKNKHGINDCVMERPHTERMDAFKQVDCINIKFANENQELEFSAFGHAREVTRNENSHRDASNEQEKAANAISRIAENFARVCAILAAGDCSNPSADNPPTISADHFDWAKRFIEIAEAHLTMAIVDRVEGEEGDKEGKALQRIVQVYETLLHDGIREKRVNRGMYVRKRDLFHSFSGREKKALRPVFEAAVRDGLFIVNQIERAGSRNTADWVAFNL